MCPFYTFLPTRPSKEAVREYMGRRPIFKRWDSRALDAYLEGGMEERALTDASHDEDLTDCPSAREPSSDRDSVEIVLKCKPKTEAGYYTGSGASVWPQLHQLGQARPVTFIAGEKSEHMPAVLSATQAVISGADAAKTLVGMMGARAKVFVVPNASHFVLMEDVDRVAELVWGHVLQTVGREASNEVCGNKRSSL
jgi:pimeloyl-ACP methyl ester carboxylesterase